MHSFMLGKLWKIDDIVHHYRLMPHVSFVWCMYVPHKDMLQCTACIQFTFCMVFTLWFRLQSPVYVFYVCLSRSCPIVSNHHQHMNKSSKCNHWQPIKPCMFMHQYVAPIYFIMWCDCNTFTIRSVSSYTNYHPRSVFWCVTPTRQTCTRGRSMRSLPIPVNLCVFVCREHVVRNVVQDHIAKC